MDQPQLVIPEEIIKEIADYLDAGMVCFYHRKTGELEYYPDPDNNPEMDEEMWRDVMKKVRKDKNFIRFEGLESHESFRIMEGFISEMTDKEIQHRFDEVILRRKPFAQFNGLLRDYPDLREQWFVYKKNRLMEEVKGQIEVYNFKG